MDELNVVVDSAKVAFEQAATPASLENAKACFWASLVVSPN